MVNPLASSVNQAIATQILTELDRRATPPEPARHVTATSETISSKTSADASQQAYSDGSLDPLQKALELINNNMQAWATGMRFDIDPEAQRVVVSIIDTATGEVLRTVPSDAVIRVAKMIVQLQGKSISTQA